MAIKDTTKLFAEPEILIDKKTLNPYRYTPINDTGEESTDKTDIQYIANPNYEIKTLDISYIAEDEIDDIAEAIYREVQLSNSSTTEVSTFTSGGESKTALQNAITNLVGALDNAASVVESAISGTASVVTEGAESIATIVRTLSSYNKSGNSLFMGTLSGIANAISESLTRYQDGITETSFGMFQEDSWYGTNTSFLNHFKNINSGVAEEERRISFLKSTPLDPGKTRESLYGTLMMGCPFLYNNFADPNNRVLTNTIIKDTRYITFTPGTPKFHGTSYALVADKDKQFNQTNDGSEMLNYLLKNGIDVSFNEKDKRYYTFQADYAAYFSYLETMLNAVWVKLGLAKNGNAFNLFTFFNIRTDSSGNISPDNARELLDQYKSSIGFFLSGRANISESVSNNETSTGQELSGQVNGNSDTYQRINYITGMGTGGSVREAMRIAGNVTTNAQNMVSFVKDTYANTLDAIKGVASAGGSGVAGVIKKVAAVAKIAVNAVKDTVTLTTTQDLASVIQSFSVSNGMKVVYPELWSDSSYSKNMSIDFTFTSPYGDPLSIFKYVYVPFCALACLALPRQAAENGYVSPFFIRADVPGLFTTDLAMISSFSWTKGGGSNLWTKDGLPRQIDVQIDIRDLYPYLAMTRRLSFLSANPSYTVFLDNMAGMCKVNNGNSEDSLNEYLQALLYRVTGDRDSSGLWNTFNSYKSAETKRINNEIRTGVSAKLNKYSYPWMHNSSI